MYKEALIAGVPFQMYQDLEPAVKEDFAVSQRLASAWRAYGAALIEKSDKENPDHGERLKRHMSLFYRWQASRLDNLEQAEFFKACSSQSQQDMRDSFRLLKGDLKVLRRRANLKASNSQDPQVEIIPKGTCNQWMWERSNQLLDDWENFALSCYDNKAALESEVTRFFDDYVHDSFAGFYLAGEVTDYDKRVKIAQVLRSPPDKLSKFDRKVLALTQKLEEVRKKKATGQKLLPEEEELLSESDLGTVYPIMSDEDTADMRSWLITTQTWTRREGGGYFVCRGYYPKEGWLFWKKPKAYENLQRSAQFIRSLQTPEQSEYVLAWSNNVRRDIEIHERIEAV